MSIKAKILNIIQKIIQKNRKPEYVTIDKKDLPIINFELITEKFNRFFSGDKFVTYANYIAVFATGGFLLLTSIISYDNLLVFQPLIEQLTSLIGMIYLLSVISYALAPSSSFSWKVFLKAITAYLFAVICFNLSLILYTLPSTDKFTFVKEQKDLIFLFVSFLVTLIYHLRSSKKVKLQLLLSAAGWLTFVFSYYGIDYFLINDSFDLIGGVLSTNKSKIICQSLI